MKKMITLASLALSLASAHSMEIETFLDPTTNDVSALIKDPVHFGSGMPFSGYSSPSSENGVCVALGYERAASGSLRSSDSKYNTIRVNSDGIVVAGPTDYSITQIVCLNYRNVFPNEKSIKLANPVHPDSNLGYSAYRYPSSENGVCRAMGYIRAAAGSLRSSETQVNTIRVDYSGNVVAGPTDYSITQIVCLTTRSGVADTNVPANVPAHSKF